MQQPAKAAGDALASTAQAVRAYETLLAELKKKGAFPRKPAVRDQVQAAWGVFLKTGQ